MLGLPTAKMRRCPSHGQVVNTIREVESKEKKIYKYQSSKPSKLK